MADTGYLHELVDGVAVVTTPAEIDITVAEQFRTALLDAARDEPARLVVDMTRTVFCDSAGIHTLVRASQRIRGDGGELRLVIPPGGTVQRILSLTGVGQIIPCFASVAEALALAPDPDRCPA